MINSYTDVDVFPGRSYKYGITARNIIGEGHLAESGDILIFNGTLPSAPVSLSYSVNGTEIVLHWDRPEYPGVGDIGSYKVLITIADVTDEVTINNVTYYHIDDFEYDLAYFVNVSAVNSFGSGPFSSTILIYIQGSDGNQSGNGGSKNKTYIISIIILLIICIAVTVLILVRRNILIKNKDSISEEQINETDPKNVIHRVDEEHHGS